MRTDKRTRLEAAGWKVGSFNEFLDLTPEESAYIEMKLSLNGELKYVVRHRNSAKPR